MVPIGFLSSSPASARFARRKTSVESLRRNFQIPGIAAVVLAGALIAAGVRHFYALVSFGFASSSRLPC